jgi:hypothetical protein
MPHRDWHLAYGCAAEVEFAGKIDRVKGAVGNEPRIQSPRFAQVNPPTVRFISSTAAGGQNAPYGSRGSARATRRPIEARLVIARRRPQGVSQHEGHAAPIADAAAGECRRVDHHCGRGRRPRPDSDRGITRASSQRPCGLGTRPALPDIRQNNESQRWQAH